MEQMAELIPTRQSLLSRLKNWDDDQSWRSFFDTYWRLIYQAARRAGLDDAEAQDVVQETVISVLKHIPEFRYDAEKGSFKGWLLRLTKWRIVDQYRKRQRVAKIENNPSADSNMNALMEDIPDPAGLGLEAAWNDEWEKNLLEAAIERVKKKTDPKKYQIYDLYVLKEWPVSKVARSLKVSPGTVYLSKHRIEKLLREEIRYLRTKPV